MSASLRSDYCSPSLRNAVRLPSGIDVHLHRNTQTDVPRYSFLWLVCPAWGLLLASIYCCSMRVASYHNTNATLLKQFSALSTNYCYQHFAILINRVSTRIKSGFRVADQPADVKQSFSQTAATLMTQATEESNKIAGLMSEAIDLERNATPFALIGTITPILAVMLLCAFAVRSVLAT